MNVAAPTLNFTHSEWGNCCLTSWVSQPMIQRKHMVRLVVDIPSAYLNIWVFGWARLEEQKMEFPLLKGLVFCFHEMGYSS